MTNQTRRPTNQDLRRLFVEISDRAVDLATSLQECGCDSNARATGSRDLNAIVQDLADVRQRVGGQPREPTCDEISVDEQSNEASHTMQVLSRPEGQQTAIEEPMTAVNQSAGSPSTVRASASVRGPLTLMRLPPEVRNMIWWETLAPEGRVISIVPYFLHPGHASLPARNVRFHSQRPVVEMGPYLRYTYERKGERGGRGAAWALLRVSGQVYEEAEHEYWRRAVAEGLMFSFTCRHFTTSYYGVATAWAFFKGCRTEYLQAIRRIHLDLRRTGHSDKGYQGQAVMLKPQYSVRSTSPAEILGPLLDLVGARLTGLRHLSLTFSGWPPRAESSEHWVTRLQNIHGLTRLRLRVVVALTNARGLLLPLPLADPGLRHTKDFLGMLRGSMLINGDALGVGNMRIWPHHRKTPHRVQSSLRVVVQCDDSWDADTGKHSHHVEDDHFDRLD